MIYSIIEFRHIGNILALAVFVTSFLYPKIEKKKGEDPATKFDYILLLLFFVLLIATSVFFAKDSSLLAETVRIVTFGVILFIIIRTIWKYFKEMR
ncbi:MAG: hypothetical protein ACQESK_00120 [Bacteroidota bacterium]